LLDYIYITLAVDILAFHYLHYLVDVAMADIVVVRYCRRCCCCCCCHLTN